MSSHTEQLVNDFRLKHIPAFRGGDREYETSAAAANLVFAFTRPGCVVQPETTEQVQYIVEQAKDAGENIIIKGGGHSYTGFSMTDRGILLDMKRMTNVKLQLSKDKKPTTVKIQGGARWVDVYRTLINGGWNKYVVIGGRCPAVGVAGFILGGGLGPFTREFGLGSDSLIEATIVTADGQKVVVSGKDGEDPDKRELFWALCGAGSNAFGVVTEFRMKVQELKEDHVIAGRYEWTPTKKQAKTFNQTMQKFYTAQWSNEMTIDSNWMLDVNKSDSGTKIRFGLYFNGDFDKFEEEIQKNIVDEDLAYQLIRRVRPELSTRFLHESLLLIWNEESRDFIVNQDDNTYQKYCSFCFTNKEEDIKNILKAVQDLQVAFKKLLDEDKASFWVTFIHAGGKVKDFRSDYSAYPWRQTIYNTYVTIKFSDKWVETIATDFLLMAKIELKKFTVGGHAAYINFSDSIMDRGWGEAYYGKNYERVKEVRKKWNPEGYFDWPWEKQNQHILKAKSLKKDKKDPINGSDLTDLPAWFSWEDKSTPVPVPPPSYSEIVMA